MDSMSEFQIALEQLELNMRNRSNDAYTALVQEVNEGLEKLLQTIVATADFVENSLREEILNIHSSLVKRDSKPKKFGWKEADDIDDKISNTANKTLNRIRNRNGMFLNKEKNTSSSESRVSFERIKGVNSEPIKVESYKLEDTDDNVKDNENGNQADINILMNDNYHVTYIDERKSYSCTQCKFISPKRKDLARHIKGVHSQVKDIDCDQCSYSTSRKDSLTRFQILALGIWNKTGTFLH